MPWYRGRIQFVGVVLIIVTNVFVLSSVWYNRSGDPDSKLTLTERELASSFNYWQGGENSGLALRPVWRMEQARHLRATSRTMTFGGEGDWLDEEKLAELGISVPARSMNNRDVGSFNSSLPTEVFLVLEMDGTAYRRAVERACEPPGPAAPDAIARQKNCEQETNKTSRLFVIDAGLDREALRKKYPDRVHCAVVRGQIQASLVSLLVPGRHLLRGYVRGLSNDEIEVPLNMRAAFGDSKSVIGTIYGQQSKPFTAVVMFGRRLEPWLADLSLGAGPSN